MLKVEEISSPIEDEWLEDPTNDRRCPEKQDDAENNDKILTSGEGDPEQYAGPEGRYRLQRRHPTGEDRG